MNQQPLIVVDPRDAGEIARQLVERRLGYVPEWQPAGQGVDAALIRIFSRYLETIIQRLNQVPEKNRLAFFDMLELSLVPAQAARAPIVFQASQQPRPADEALEALKAQIDSLQLLARQHKAAAQTVETLTAQLASAPVQVPAARITHNRAPAGTRIAAAPPPGETEQIVFETDRAIAIATARLQNVISVLPDDDAYIDHSTDLHAGQPVRLFTATSAEQRQVPHELYLAHESLFALAGEGSIRIEFKVRSSTENPLPIAWEYSDGQQWHALEIESDTSNGLSDSGSLTLQFPATTTGGESEQVQVRSGRTAVNGIESYWIRGRFTEPLPPTVTFIPWLRVGGSGATITKRLASLRHARQSSQGRFAGSVMVVVRDENEQLLPGVRVTLANRQNGDGGILKVATTNESGEVVLSHSFEGGQQYDVGLVLSNNELTFRYEHASASQQVEFDISLTGDTLDTAFADGTALDVSKAFTPFGAVPQPGSTFYFSQEEAFSRPGAQLQVYVARTESPQDRMTPDPTTVPLNPEVSWEYWNGRGWAVLRELDRAAVGGSPVDLDHSGIINLTVPTDMDRREVNGEDGLWMRVRLVSGGFGFTQATKVNDTEFTHIVNQPPVLSEFRLGYTWEESADRPERIVTRNESEYALVQHGAMFQPFTAIDVPDRALYLGLDEALPNDQSGLFLDIEEDRKTGESDRPTARWEYFNGQWQVLAVEDETRGLTVPGILSFIGPRDSKSATRFGQQRHWLRCRLPDGKSPVINRVLINAVWASQHAIFHDTPLGSSNGTAEQVFRLSQTPVLAGQRIEVRELVGPRAAVEWRIVVRGLTGGDEALIHDLEEILERAKAQTDVVSGDIRLRLDRERMVREVWVRWHSRPHLLFSGPEDRHYVVDRTRGLFFFGDGRRGRIPPAGAAVLAREFRSGGGRAGNVASGSISQVLGAIQGAQNVFNPRPAEGGADSEALESFARRAPSSLRHRGRAVSVADYETMAFEASPAVAVARVMPGSTPGLVRLLIIPDGQEPRPQPSFGLREHVRRYIEAFAPADLAHAHAVHVVGPEYLAINIEATIAAVDSGDPAVVKDLARTALEGFFHPLRGGPRQRGWELGRDVFLSDVAAILERVPDVDYVEHLQMSMTGLDVATGERVEVPDDEIVAAGEIRLELKEAAR